MADTDASALSETNEIPGAKRPVPGTWEMVIMVASLMALNALSIDIMLPALREISYSVGLTASPELSDNRQQLIIFAYILGFGAPQLVWGPISDRFGRRAPLFVGLIGFMAATLACAFTRDFVSLLAMRFLQGVFVSGARVISVSVVRDLFAGRQMARFMSLVMTIFMVIPIIAPTIGHMILLVAPWEWIFGVLFIQAALLLFWTWSRLPETLPTANRQPLSLRNVLSAYGQVIKTPVTFGYMAASGIVFGALFAFIASSEQIFVEVFNKPDTFAYWFAGVAGMMAVANFTNARLVERLGMRFISHTALIMFTCLALIQALASNLLGESFPRFYPLFIITFACFGLMGSNFSALAMEPLGKIAGTASAAYGFATSTVSSLIGMAIGYYYNGTTIPMTLGYVCLGAVSLAVILITERGRLFSRA